MSAIGLLSEIVAQGAKAAAGPLRSNPDYQSLVRHGYLSEAGVVSSIACMECESPHDAEIVFDDGQYGYFCHEFGFVAVQRADIQSVVQDYKQLVERLADAFSCKRRRLAPVHESTWRIGAVETGHGELALYFQPVLKDELHAFDLVDALNREVRSSWRLIVTATGLLPIPGTKSVLLRDLVTLNAKDGGLIAQADPGEFLGVPKNRKIGSPNLYEKSLVPLIHSRIQNNKALTGVNEEARAILNEFQNLRPGEKAPSLPTIKRYLSGVRNGS